jgi:hypothetical protein
MWLLSQMMLMKQSVLSPHTSRVYTDGKTISEGENNAVQDVHKWRAYSRKENRDA